MMATTSVAVAAGNEGIVLKTTNSGATWASLVSSVSVFGGYDTFKYHSVAFISTSATLLTPTSCICASDGFSESAAWYSGDISDASTVTWYQEIVIEDTSLYSIGAFDDTYLIAGTARGQAGIYLRTIDPTGTPTGQPSGTPTTQPSGEPTTQPSRQPTGQPTTIPSGSPTGQPTAIPSGRPTTQPSGKPTGQPSSVPSGEPTSQPSSKPSAQPRTMPSGIPSGQPTARPTLVRLLVCPALYRVHNRVWRLRASQPACPADSLLRNLVQSRVRSRVHSLRENRVDSLLRCPPPLVALHLPNPRASLVENPQASPAAGQARYRLVYPRVNRVCSRAGSHQHYPVHNLVVTLARSHQDSRHRGLAVSHRLRHRVSPVPNQHPRLRASPVDSLRLHRRVSRAPRLRDDHPVNPRVSQVLSLVDSLAPGLVCSQVVSLRHDLRRNLVVEECWAEWSAKCTTSTQPSTHPSAMPSGQPSATPTITPTTRVPTGQPTSNLVRSPVLSRRQAEL